jgi:hypothetical protein
MILTFTKTAIIRKTENFGNPDVVYPLLLEYSNILGMLSKFVGPFDEFLSINRTLDK